MKEMQYTYSHESMKTVHGKGDFLSKRFDHRFISAAVKDSFTFQLQKCIIDTNSGCVYIFV